MLCVAAGGRTRGWWLPRYSDPARDWVAQERHEANVIVGVSCARTGIIADPGCRRSLDGLRLPGAGRAPPCVRRWSGSAVRDPSRARHGLVAVLAAGVCAVEDRARWTTGVSHYSTERNHSCLATSPPITRLTSLNLNNVSGHDSWWLDQLWVRGLLPASHW